MGLLELNSNTFLILGWIGMLVCLWIGRNG
jgi:hypothetical protein